MPSSACKTSALRSEEHTSELQSHDKLVCRLLLEQKSLITRWKRSNAQAWTLVLTVSGAAPTVVGFHLWGFLLRTSTFFFKVFGAPRSFFLFPTRTLPL